MIQKKIKIVLLSFWVLLIASFIWSLYHFNVSISDIPLLLERWLKEFGLINAALVYIVLYTLRPLIFFPATLLTLLSGTLFGPIYGILFTIIGENFSANLAFFIARHLGKDWVQTGETGFIARVDKGLRENGIVTTLILRFIYLPFDAVNYGCGLTSMRHQDYAIGTFFGILPGLITFVLLGATASAQATGTIGIGSIMISKRLLILLLSGIFFILGLLIARMLKQRSATAQSLS